jgi:hypothetical protein
MDSFTSCIEQVQARRMRESLRLPSQWSGDGMFLFLFVSTHTGCNIIFILINNKVFNLLQVKVRKMFTRIKIVIRN